MSFSIRDPAPSPPARHPLTFLPLCAFQLMCVTVSSQPCHLKTPCAPTSSLRLYVTVSRLARFLALRKMQCSLMQTSLPSAAVLTSITVSLSTVEPGKSDVNVLMRAIERAPRDPRSSSSCSIPTPLHTAVRCAKVGLHHPGLDDDRSSPHAYSNAHSADVDT